MKYACLAVLVLWSTPTMAEVPALCADAPNQAEGTLCAKRKLDAAEAGLAKTRDALQAKLDVNGRRNLRPRAAGLEAVPRPRMPP